MFDRILSICAKDDDAIIYFTALFYSEQAPTRRRRLSAAQNTRCEGSDSRINNINFVNVCVKLHHLNTPELQHRFSHLFSQ
jgi:hypothetical protein